MNGSTPTQEIPRYRQILKKDLAPHLLKPDNLHLFWLLPHFAIIGTSLWLLTAYFSWWIAPLLSLVIGHSFGCMGFVAHETCHGGAIKNKKLRHFLTSVAFSPFGIGAYLWSRWHNAEHHGHTQHKELDPDRLFMVDEYKHNPALKWLYGMSPFLRSTVIFSFFTMMMTQHNITMVLTYMKDPEATAQQRATILWQFFAAKLFWIGLTLMLGWQVFLFGYVVPLLVGNALVISYIATNHFLNPLADESDVLGSSLSVTWPRWLKWVDVMHMHFGAHVAHHVFPQAPSRHAREIEQRMGEIWPDRFHVMPFSKALKLLWQTEWVYDEQGTHLMDPETGSSQPTLGHGLAEPIDEPTPVPLKKVLAGKTGGQ